MKNLTKILGLLSLVLMVSCGSKSTSMKDLGSCINGDKEVCRELGDETPPTETPVADFVMTDIETITYGTDPLYTFDKVTALGLLKFKTETINFGGGFGEGRREILINENGELLFNIWIGTGANAELYHSNSTTWSFEGNDLRIDGASITYTTI